MRPPPWPTITADRGLAADEGADDVDLDRPPPDVDRVLGDRRHVADAGVVDEEVDPRRRRRRPRATAARDRVLVGDVDLEGERSGAELLGGLLGAVAVLVEDRDPGAGGGEGGRDLVADPPRPTRDDPALAGQLRRSSRASIDPHRQPPY